MLTINDLYAIYSKQLPPVTNVPVGSTQLHTDYFIHTNARSNLNLLDHLTIIIESNDKHTKLCIDLGYVFILGHYDTDDTWKSISYVDVVELFSMEHDGKSITNNRIYLDNVTFVKSDKFSMVVDEGHGNINIPTGNIEVFPVNYLSGIALYNDFRLSLLRSLINAKRIVFKNYF